MRKAKSKWMTMDSAAKLVGVSHTKLFHAVKAGEVESMTIEGGLVVRVGRPIYTLVNRESAIKWREGATAPTLPTGVSPEIQHALNALVAAIQMQATSA